MPGEDDEVFDEAAIDEAAESRRDETADMDEGFLGDCREDVPYGERCWLR